MLGLDAWVLAQATLTSTGKGEGLVRARQKRFAALDEMRGWAASGMALAQRRLRAWRAWVIHGLRNDGATG